MNDKNIATDMIPNIRLATALPSVCCWPANDGCRIGCAVGGTFNQGEVEAGTAGGVLGALEADRAGCAPAAGPDAAAVGCVAPVDAAGCTGRPQLGQKLVFSGSEAPQLLQNMRPLFVYLFAL